MSELARNLLTMAGRSVKNKPNTNYMADVTTPKPVAPTPVTKALPSKEELLKQLDVVDAKAKEQAGSPHFNPFLWIKRNTADLRIVIKAAQTVVTAELVGKVAALKVPAPVK